MYSQKEHDYAELEAFDYGLRHGSPTAGDSDDEVDDDDE